ncbi:hypothetical protein ABZ860_27665 [Microbispora sp. NPDC046973]|uniref:hypothetical protein n=1 Tax=Microbispora sp. NPDC046973 TaxID=3155022 RepID=UPI0033E7EF0C
MWSIADGCAAVEFVGGPADGRWLTVRVDLDTGVPPLRHELLWSPPQVWWAKLEEPPARPARPLPAAGGARLWRRDVAVLVREGRRAW